ncbi:MAG: hypothetical protein ACXW2K_17170, partial [Allosphingosinicella sp.]
MSTSLRKWRPIGLNALVLGLALPNAAFAQDQAPDIVARLARLEAIVAEQQSRLEAQDAEIARLRADQPLIADEWRVRSDAELRADSARGPIAWDFGVEDPPQTGPQTPVAAPPALELRRAELAAIPEGLAVLSHAGRASFDLSAEYTRSSSNRLVFRGIEIVPGIQIGVIEANEADRDTLSSNLAMRYGLTDRLEIEARVPFVRRSDTVTTVQQRDEAVTRTIDLNGEGVGDVEGSVRYQFNRGARGGPIYVGAIRVKSDTGEGPFDIDRDEFGIATRLATGSGFWGIEPSLSVLFASDPAVLFGNLSYFSHLPRDVDKTEGDITVGRVDPGDSIGASIGFGFAMNQKFSFSLGYRHNYIFPTESELNGQVEKSDELQVGALLLGLSYRFNDKYSLNLNFEFGVTGDSPDMRFTARVP